MCFDDNQWVLQSMYKEYILLDWAMPCSVTQQEVMSSGVPTGNYILFIYQCTVVTGYSMVHAGL
jgi:hypothetical protein